MYGRLQPNHVYCTLTVASWISAISLLAKYRIESMDIGQNVGKRIIYGPTIGQIKISVLV